MHLPLVISVFAALDGGAPAGGVATLDAGPDLIHQQLQSQAWRLRECAPHVDGGEETVTIDFSVGVDGGDFVRLVGTTTKAGRCANVFANSFQFHPELRVRRAQSFVIARDGGVQLRAYPGGGLEKSEIYAVIKAHTDNVKRCYEAQLQLHGDLAGKLTVAWLVGPAGDVLEATVREQTIGDPLVTNCVLDQVRTWRFPEPVNGGTVNVTFPYIFVAADAGEASPQSPPQSPTQPP